MSAEPSLDAPVLPHNLDKLSAIPLVGMIQPTTSIHNVIPLDAPDPTPIQRSVTEHEYPPPLVGRLALLQLLKPTNLILVNNHLVTRKLGLPEKSSAQPHYQRRLHDLSTELQCFLIVGGQELL